MRLAFHGGLALTALIAATEATTLAQDSSLDLAQTFAEADSELYTFQDKKKGSDSSSDKDKDKKKADKKK